MFNLQLDCEVFKAMAQIAYVFASLRGKSKVCMVGTQILPPPGPTWEIKSTNTYFAPAGGKALLPDSFSVLVYIKASQAKI